MRRGRLSQAPAQGSLLPWTRCALRLSPRSPDRPRDPRRGKRPMRRRAAIVAEVVRHATCELGHVARCGWRSALTAHAACPTRFGAGRRWCSPSDARHPSQPRRIRGSCYAHRTQHRAAPQIRRSATHPIGRPHSSAVPQPADTWLLVGQVPAMVSQAHFDEVQAKLATNQSFARRNKGRKKLWSNRRKVGIIVGDYNRWTFPHDPS